MARAAEQNVSIFRREGPIPRREILEEYIRMAVKFDMPFHNCKYVVLIIWPTSMGKELREKVAKARSYVDMWYVPIAFDVLVYP